MQGFEVATHSFLERLFALAATLYKRMLVRMLVETDGAALTHWRLHLLGLCPNLSLLVFQSLEKSQVALIWTIQEMPEYLHHQLVSTIIFLSRMPSFTSTRQGSRKLSRPCGPNIAYMDSIQTRPYTTTPAGGRRKTKSPTFEKECSIKGCVGR